jgi:hypothetical protein
MTISGPETSYAFEKACARILNTHPEAIGVAFKWLDCGCVLLCGVSGRGDPVGSLEHIASHAESTRKAPICLQCQRDSGLSRVVWQGFHWPGRPEERPAPELRRAIGRKVFGEGYSEPDSRIGSRP